MALHDGTGWVTKIFTELSLAVPNTVDTIYDAFVYLNSGTPTLEATAWASGTARATALTTLDGVIVKTGATTRRYLGSFRTTNASGNTADSATFRYLWNYYNRVERTLSIANATSHTFDSTWRPFNNDQANSSVNFIIGLVDQAVHASLNASLTMTAGGSSPQIGIGVNATSSASVLGTLGIAGTLRIDYCETNFFPILGYSFICANEQGSNTGADPTFANISLQVVIKG